MKVFKRPAQWLKLDEVKTAVLNHQRKPPSIYSEEDEKQSDSKAANAADKSNDAKPVAKKTSETGCKAQVKDLYWHMDKRVWKDYPPKHLNVSLKDSPKLQTWALIRRRKKDKSGVLRLDSITIQSPYLRDLLDKVFDGYRGISTKLSELHFSEPFHPFYYRWDRFQEELTKVQKSGDETAKAHAELLRRVMTKEIQPHLDMMKDYYANGIISFDYVWALFEPEVEIYAENDGQDRLFKLNSSEYTCIQGQNLFALQSNYVDYDGVSFGCAEATLLCPAWSGVQKISSLKVLPVHLHPNPKELRDRLVARGEAFERLSGFHYRAYDGFLLYPNRDGSKDKRQIQGRVIVDAKTHSVYNGGLSSTLRPLSELNDPSPPAPTPTAVSPEDDYDDDLYGSSSRQRRHVPPPKPVPDTQPKFKGTVIKMADEKAGNVALANALTHRTNKNKVLELTRDQHALCTPSVKGFCLSTKKWVTLFVDNINDITWSDDAFKRLILPYDFKELLLAFLQSQFAGTNKFDDIIQGKGKGIIILLSGSPGTGKTLTAEAVAEEIKQPLYIMSAGELGYTADEVEKNLQKVLEITTNWKAVLLIDECDVFLEERDTSHMERNKLVSVFLRLLEYHKGVLFLTTNRVSSFDKAFKSRIHLTVNYPDLDADTKKHIWETFIEQANRSASQPARFSDKDLQTLATKELNGREIKNVVKTAQLLATRKEEPLTVDHIRTVLRVSGDRKLLESSGQSSQGMYM